MTPSGVEILAEDPVLSADCEEPRFERGTGLQGEVRYRAEVEAAARLIDLCRAATRKAAGL